MLRAESDRKVILLGIEDENLRREIKNVSSLISGCIEATEIQRSKTEAAIQKLVQYDVETARKVNYLESDSQTLEKEIKKTAGTITIISGNISDIETQKVKIEETGNLLIKIPLEFDSLRSQNGLLLQEKGIKESKKR